MKLILRLFCIHELYVKQVAHYLLIAVNFSTLERTLTHAELMALVPLTLKNESQELEASSKLISDFSSSPLQPLSRLVIKECCGQPQPNIKHLCQVLSQVHVLFWDIFGLKRRNVYLCKKKIQFARQWQGKSRFPCSLTR